MDGQVVAPGDSGARNGARSRTPAITPRQYDAIIAALAHSRRADVAASTGLRLQTIERIARANKLKDAA